MICEHRALQRLLNQQKRKKTYNEHCVQVEHGSFTSQLIWAKGGISRECRNDMQGKKNQLQCNSYMDPKKNCIFVNKMSWNDYAWKLLSFSE